MQCPVCKKSELAIRNDNSVIACPECGKTFVGQNRAIDAACANQLGSSTKPKWPKLLRSEENQCEGGEQFWFQDGVKLRWKLGWVFALALALVYVKTGYELSNTIAKSKDLMLQIGQLKVELEDMSKTAIRLMGERVIKEVK